jgi:hypothetical protein
LSWTIHAAQIQRESPQKIPKASYRVTNWPEYDAALMWRGDLRCGSPRKQWRHGTPLPPESVAVSQSIRLFIACDRNGWRASAGVSPAASSNKGHAATIAEALKVGIAISSPLGHFVRLLLTHIEDDGLRQVGRRVTVQFVGSTKNMDGNTEG